MNKRNGIRLVSVILAAVMTISFLSGCGANNAKEDADTISV